MSTLLPEQVRQTLLPKLRSPRVTFFPVRHHSPACAIHVERWILENKPCAILVEGPTSFTTRIERLVDERCQSPVALYTSFVDKKGRARELIKFDRPTDEAGEEPDDSPLRFAAYFPFCDYSPELVALRVGKAVGARLSFIDMEYADLILTRLAAHKNVPEQSETIDSLAEDSHLKHSAYIKALSRKLGCRDFDELWDHLFETAWVELSTDDFIDRVATYCAMARLDYSEGDLTRDGTMARELHMAAAIRDELARADGQILVVTGGFHSVALPDLVAGSPESSRATKFSDDEVGVWLMRYSFDKLDALSGYAAGMRAPAFYDQMFHAGRQLSSGDGHSMDLEIASAEVAVRIARMSRERRLAEPITTPDAIAAVEMAKQLAAMRGHPWPMREDILDGMRSCFIKGESAIEGIAVLSLIREAFAGTRVGQVPPGGELPPIVADFYRECKRLRINIEQVEQKEYSLDLYRNPNHRRISRLFHRLDLLGAPFAQFLAGPDFVTGQRLELMREQWLSCWSPVVDSALIDASLLGSTIEEAAASKIKKQIADLEKQGQGRSSAVAVTLLIRACRLGLHAQSASLVPLIDVHIAEDAQMISVVNALSQLDLLRGAREPLEATHLTALPRLIEAAYQRACRLLPDTIRCPADTVVATINAFKILREILSSSGQHATDIPLDSELFFMGLRQILQSGLDQAHSAIVGAAAGILHGEGIIDDEQLIAIVCGYLTGAVSDPRKCVGVLHGLLATASEVTWQLGEVIRALDMRLSEWDDDTFIDLLPELRIAFAFLTPREVAKVAENISNLHGGASLGDLVHVDVEESEVVLATKLNKLVRDSLVSDELVAE